MIISLQWFRITATITVLCLVPSVAWPAFYALGVIATFAYNKLLIYISQGSIKHLRDDLFTHMQDLPIRYFDTHSHGDIMSVYTNDIDTLRQVISQSIPQLLNSVVTIVNVFIYMIILNIPLTVITLIMVAITVFITGKFASFFQPLLPCTAGRSR